nr:type I restriction enzyme endonuclease domain-containing protein [Marinobacter sp. LV10R510-11A]
MWLTGFDAPCCHTMYVDKPMKGHNLMQAIARVNRVFKDKPGGLVVDYIGIANELKLALKTYTDANYILGLEDGKKRFLDTVLAMNKAFSLCATLDEAQALQKEVAFLSQVKTAITKFTSVDKKLTEEDKKSALKQILDNALIGGGVTDVFALCGLDRPNIGLLSEEFLEDVRQMPYKNFAVELLEKLLKDDIKAKTRNNVVQEKKYADRLQETLRKYNNRGIETAQVIEELIAMAKQFQAEMERDAALGLNPDEVAFYDALASNESAGSDCIDYGTSGSVIQSLDAPLTWPQ